MGDKEYTATIWGGSIGVLQLLTPGQPDRRTAVDVRSSRVPKEVQRHSLLLEVCRQE